MAEIVTHDTQSAEPGEFAAYLKAQTPEKPAARPLETAQPVEPAPEPAPAPPQKAQDATPEPPWEDPETGETVEKPTRGDKRIKRLWAEKQEAKTRAERLEQELADLRAQIAPGTPAAAPAAVPKATTEADALTMAAQARIRAKPDRAAIGTMYATYEDYVEDCAIWGGELAAEKRVIHAETTAAEVAEQRRQSTFAESVAAARADYDDFEEVTTQALPTNQAMFDAVTNAPKDLAGHVLYWLGTHAADDRRIAGLAYGPALVAMGEVLATVKAERAAKTAPPAAPERKPISRAPAPLQPAGRNGGAPTRPDQVAESAGSVMDYIRLRNEQTARRY